MRKKHNKLLIALSINRTKKENCIMSFIRTYAEEIVLMLISLIMMIYTLNNLNASKAVEVDTNYPDKVVRIQRAPALGSNNE